MATKITGLAETNEAMRARAVKLLGLTDDFIVIVFTREAGRRKIGIVHNATEEQSIWATNALIDIVENKMSETDKPKEGERDEKEHRN